jgi:hypothetical protein
MFYKMQQDRNSGSVTSKHTGYLRQHPDLQLKEKEFIHHHGILETGWKMVGKVLTVRLGGK